MVLKYIVDVNVPSNVPFWQTDEFEFQIFKSKTAKDNEIWEYAKQNNLTIITKDTDFSNRIILVEPPPKVIHLKLGNMKIKDFLFFLNTYWDNIVTASEENKLIKVFSDRIEMIN